MIPGQRRNLEADVLENQAQDSKDWLVYAVLQAKRTWTAETQLHPHELDNEKAADEEGIEPVATLIERTNQNVPGVPLQLRRPMPCLTDRYGRRL